MAHMYLLFITHFCCQFDFCKIGLCVMIADLCVCVNKQRSPSVVAATKDDIPGYGISSAHGEENKIQKPSNPSTKNLEWRHPIQESC